MIGPHTNTYCYQEQGHPGNCGPLVQTHTNNLRETELSSESYKKQLEDSRRHYGMCLGCGRVSPEPGRRLCIDCQAQVQQSASL